MDDTWTVVKHSTETVFMRRDESRVQHLMRGLLMVASDG